MCDEMKVVNEEVVETEVAVAEVAAVQPEEPEEIVDEDMEETIPIRKFRPKREEENDDEYTEENEEPSKIQAVKDKAKNILGDIFPFKED